MNKLFTLFLVLFSLESEAQCKTFVNEPIDSLQGIVKMVERLSGYHLYTNDLQDSSLTKISYSVVKEERGSQGNSLVEITAKYSYKDKIVDGNVVSMRTDSRVVEIYAPTATICLIMAEIRKSLSSCTLIDGGTFIKFGNKEKPFRLLSMTKCDSDALFGKITIMDN